MVLEVWFFNYERLEIGRCDMMDSKDMLNSILFDAGFEIRLY